MIQQKFDFQFLDTATGAVLLVVPSTLEKINHLLGCLHVKASKGFLTDDFWHLLLTFNGIEIVIRVSTSDANDLRVQAPQLAELVFQMYGTLVSTFARSVLVAEIQKDTPNALEIGTSVN